MITIGQVQCRSTATAATGALLHYQRMNCRSQQVAVQGNQTAAAGYAFKRPQFPYNTNRR